MPVHLALQYDIFALLYMLWNKCDVILENNSKKIKFGVPINYTTILVYTQNNFVLIFSFNHVSHNYFTIDIHTTSFKCTFSHLIMYPDLAIVISEWYCNSLSIKAMTCQAGSRSRWLVYWLADGYLYPDWRIPVSWLGDTCILIGKYMYPNIGEYMYPDWEIFYPD